MKDFFTSSSDLLKQKQKQMIGGNNIPSHPTDTGYNLCYSNRVRQNGSVYHPTWNNEHCHQYGGSSPNENTDYKLYKKYKLKYKSSKLSK